MHLDPLLASAAPAIWAGAGLFASALPNARTAAALRRRTLMLLTALTAAAGTGLVLGRPPLTIAAVLALAIAVPRLLRLRTSAGWFALAGRETPVPPSLRAAAAHPAIAAPVQVAACLAVAAPFLTVALATTVVPLLAIALTLIVSGDAARHRRVAAGALLPRTSMVIVPAAKPSIHQRIPAV